MIFLGLLERDNMNKELISVLLRTTFCASFGGVSFTDFSHELLVGFPEMSDVSSEFQSTLSNQLVRS